MRHFATGRYRITDASSCVRERFWKNVMQFSKRFPLFSDERFSFLNFVLNVAFNLIFGLIFVLLLIPQGIISRCVEGLRNGTLRALLSPRVHALPLIRAINRTMVSHKNSGPQIKVKRFDSKYEIMICCIRKFIRIYSIFVTNHSILVLFLMLVHTNL